MTEITRTDWSALPVGYFSPSQAWSMIACGYCYYLERIERIPKPVSADLMIGRWAHASVAEMRRQLVEQQEFDTEQAVEAGAAAFDEVIERRIDVEETGEESPIEIELTRKYESLDEAKDTAARLTRYVLPQIAKYDRQAGVVAYESRVRHLGTSFRGYPDLFNKLNDEEREDAEDEAREQFVDGVKPSFPFPVKAYLDVLYGNGVLKDLKTSSRNGSPDALASLQLLLYGMPWYDAGQPLKLGFDVAIKTRTPGFSVYWLNGTGEVTPEQYEYARRRVLQAADMVCRGDFVPNDGNLFCRYDHGLPKGELAASFPGIEVAV